MSVEHASTFTFHCTSPSPACVPLTVKAKTRRNAIHKARAAKWFVGAVRVVFGMAKSKVKTHRVELCPRCRWSIGAL